MRTALLALLLLASLSASADTVQLVRPSNSAPLVVFQAKAMDGLTTYGSALWEFSSVPSIQVSLVIDAHGMGIISCQATISTYGATSLSELSSNPTLVRDSNAVRTYTASGDASIHKAFSYTVNRLNGYSKLTLFGSGTGCTATVSMISLGYSAGSVAVGPMESGTTFGTVLGANPVFPVVVGSIDNTSFGSGVVHNLQSDSNGNLLTSVSGAVTVSGAELDGATDLVTSPVIVGAVDKSTTPETVRSLRVDASGNLAVGSVAADRSIVAPSVVLGVGSSPRLVSASAGGTGMVTTTAARPGWEIQNVGTSTIWCSTDTPASNHYMKALAADLTLGGGYGGVWEEEHATVGTTVTCIADTTDGKAAVVLK